MRFFVVLSTLSVLSVFVNCTGNTVDFSDMPDYPVESVEFETLNESFLFSYPKELLLFNDKLIICDSKTDKLIHIFDKETGEYQGGYVNKGRGPGEAIDFHSVYCDNGKLFGIDANLNKILVFDLNDDSVKEFSTAGLEFWPTKILPYKDNEVVLYAGSEACRFAVYDLDASMIRFSYNLYPPMDEKKETVRSIFKYAGNLSVNPSKDKIVSATYIGSILEILHINTDNIQSNVCKYYHEPVFEFQKGTVPLMVKTIEKTIVGFYDLCATDLYIYGLIWNCTSNDIELNKRKPQIVALDYNGQPQWGIENENGRIRQFIVDEITNTIYALIKIDGVYKLQKYAMR